MGQLGRYSVLMLFHMADIPIAEGLALRTIYLGHVLIPLSPPDSSQSFLSILPIYKTVAIAVSPGETVPSIQIT
jgi:hypothetical protein